MLAGNTHTKLGQTIEAESYLTHAAELSSKLRAGNFAVQIYSSLAFLADIQSLTNQAIEYAQQSVELTETVGKTFGGPTAYAVLALVSDSTQDTITALDEGERLLNEGSVAHNQFGFAEYATQAALKIGDFERVERYADKLQEFTVNQPLALSELIDCQKQDTLCIRARQT